MPRFFPPCFSWNFPTPLAKFRYLPGSPSHKQRVNKIIVPVRAAALSLLLEKYTAVFTCSCFPVAALQREIKIQGCVNKWHIDLWLLSSQWWLFKVFVFLFFAVSPTEWEANCVRHINEYQAYQVTVTHCPVKGRTFEAPHILWPHKPSDLRGGSTIQQWQGKRADEQARPLRAESTEVLYSPKDWTLGKVPPLIPLFIIREWCFFCLPRQVETTPFHLKLDLMFRQGSKQVYDLNLISFFNFNLHLPRQAMKSRLLFTNVAFTKSKGSVSAPLSFNNKLF